MRLAFIVLLVAAALVQAAIDWQATIGQGYAYRLTPIGTLVEQTWPEGYASTVAAIESNLPWLWDPIGATLMAIPVSLALLAIAAILWFTRRRHTTRF